METIGQGIDYHRLIKNKNSQVKLGGFAFKSNYKIVAHSDGDVVLHSISNAILGAIGRGDIGDYFKDTDPKNRNLNSVKILNFCLKLKKIKIINIDLTVICEKIILNDKKSKIKSSLQKLTKCKNVNVKATRFEEHNNNKIGCYSVVYLKY